MHWGESKDKFSMMLKMFNVVLKNNSYIDCKNL